MQRPRPEPRRDWWLPNPATGFVAAMTKTNRHRKAPNPRLPTGSWRCPWTVGWSQVDGNPFGCVWLSLPPRNVGAAAYNARLQRTTLPCVEVWAAPLVSRCAGMIVFSSLLCHPGDVVSGGDWVAAETPSVGQTNSAEEQSEDC